jgi:glycine betaine/proline transport system ATP-binding protein
MDTSRTLENGPTISSGILLEEAARTFADTGEGEANIVNSDGRPIGVLNVHDTIYAMVTPATH